MHRKKLLAMALLIICLGGGACRRTQERARDLKQSPDAAPAKASTPPPVPGPRSTPVQVSALTSQVHFAFRQEGEEHLAWHDTYTARVGASGALTVTPQQTRRSRGKGGRVLSELESGGPVTVRLVAIEKGGRAIKLDRGVFRPEADGVLSRELAGGDLLERLVNSERGVTLAWTFVKAPAGEGDLTVRLRVSGMSHVGATPAGHHFAMRPGELGVRVGEATWGDAAGKQKQRNLLQAGQELHVSVPGRFVETGVTPLRMSVTLTPELGLDKPIQGPLRVNQEAPAVARLETGYLVAWRDRRGGGRHDIWAARVSAEGKVLDPSGLLVHRSVANSDRPVLVRGPGGEALVVWQGYTGEKRGLDIMAARVSSAGTVLDPEGIVVCGAPEAQAHPRASFGDGAYLLVWEDRRSGKQFNIHGARVSGATGEVLDPGGFPVSTAGKHKKHPAVCHRGSEALVVWTELRPEGTRIRGARIIGAGKVLEPEGIAVGEGTGAGEQSFPAVGCDPGGYLVAWQEIRDGVETGTDIHGARVNLEGKVVQPGARVLILAGGEQERLALARSGEAYLAVWQDRRASNQPDIYGARINAGLQVLDPGGRLISAAMSFQEQPAVVGGGGGSWFVVWQDRRHGSSYDVYGARVNVQGQVQDAGGVNISGTPYVQVSPRLAAAGARAMVAWQDFRGDGYGDVLGARLELSPDDGVALADAAGIPLSRTPLVQLEPDLVSAGQDYLVVWRDLGQDTGGDITAALVDSATGKVKGAPVVLWPAEFPVGPPAVGFTGEHFVVAWQQQRATREGGEIMGALVSRQGKPLGTGAVTLGTTHWSGRPIRPALAMGADKELLVVWEDRQGDPAGDIQGCRVRVDGELKVLDEKGLPICAGQGAQTAPAVSRLGDGYLVAWQDERPGGRGADIHGARVSAAGQVLDAGGVSLAAASGQQLRPALAWDGTRALVVWQDERPGSHGADIVGMVVAPGEVPRGKPERGMVLAGSAANELSPALSNGGSGGFLLGYQRFDPAARGVVSQVEVRRLTLPAGLSAPATRP